MRVLATTIGKMNGKQKLLLLSLFLVAGLGSLLPKSIFSPSPKRTYSLFIQAMQDGDKKKLRQLSTKRGSAKLMYPPIFNFEKLSEKQKMIRINHAFAGAKLVATWKFPGGEREDINVETTDGSIGNATLVFRWKSGEWKLDDVKYSYIMVIPD